MIDLLILLLRPAAAFERDKRRYWYLLPVALVAWCVDVVIARTTWVLVTGGWPRWSEVTVSHTLERLAAPATAAAPNPDPDQAFYWQLGLKITRATKSAHVKVVTR